MFDDQGLAALALTSRLVHANAKPFSAREFWALCAVVEPSTLQGTAAAEIASDLGIDVAAAERIAALLDRGAGFALTLEKLDHSGIWTLTALDQGYPRRLREQLGDNAPVVLHGVGDTELLDANGVGVLGSRDTTAAGAEAAAEIGSAAVQLGLTVVSGAAPGVDQAAMNNALKAGGRVVGALADPLDATVRRRGIRQGVVRGQICLVTPYPPSAAFSAGNALGRAKIIYGLSRCTLVVTADLDAGNTWAGATEALQQGYGRVAAWTGAGCGTGNAALIERGAIGLAEVGGLGQLLAANR